MIDPEVELRKYLITLIERFFLYILRLKDELETLQNWSIYKPDGVETLNEGASFFKLVEKSFKQTLLIELYKFINEKKSLRNFLIKAKEYSNSVKPTKFNLDTGNRDTISSIEYKKVIIKHLKWLNAKNDIINNLKSRRNKELAHTDPTFFDYPENHYNSYPLPDDDISQLIETVSEILREQGLLFGEGDMDLKTVYTVNNLDRVLQFVRAFYRAQKDKQLPDNGIYVMKYRWDNYGKENV